ncbi:YjgN family protein [Massilia niabensis]|uniref:YjgN family protein n=1 Tax=Massilia niabensis TaxID=544910 RepID=A0ABW0L8A2_9BURK
MLPADLPVPSACPCEHAGAGASAALHPGPRTFIFRFTGSGHEYFRIWVVNLLLSLATFGIYSAWAKVRRLQYFDRNTSLAGATFDFHGSPKAILHGRLLALALLASYQYAIGFSAGAGLAIAVGLLLAAPFLMRGALRFRLGHTSYRAIPFAFTGSVRHAYLAYMAPAILFVLPGVMIAVFGEAAWTALALLLYAAWPLMSGLMKRYQYGHVRYGDLASSTSLPLRGFTGIYLLGAVWMAAACALVVLLVFCAAVVVAPRTTGDLVMWIFGATTLLIIGVLAYLMLGPYQQVRVLNFCLARTCFPGVRFVSTLSLRPYMRLQLRNMALTILSLGLYRPFAVVAAYRYRMEHLAVRCEGDIDAILAGASRPQGAAGDGATDFFGIDLSW